MTQNNTADSIPTPSQLCDLAVDIAREAGQLLSNRRAADLDVHTKSTATDVVTAMDKASEALIVQRITAARPDDAILGEEGTSRAGITGIRWIIDPLDGTVNYLYQLPAWAVSIGVERDGDIVAGAVYDARSQKIYDAYLTGGARYDGQPISCSTASDLAFSLIGTGYHYAAANRARQGKIAALMLPQVRDLRRIGSAALDLCAVAHGRLDGFYEQFLFEWDRAAGRLIATEAGARFAIFDDEDPDVTFATAPAIFDQLRHAYVATRHTTDSA